MSPITYLFDKFLWYLYCHQNIFLSFLWSYESVYTIIKEQFQFWINEYFDAFGLLKLLTRQRRWHVTEVVMDWRWHIWRVYCIRESLPTWLIEYLMHYMCNSEQTLSCRKITSHLSCSGKDVCCSSALFQANSLIHLSFVLQLPSKLPPILQFPSPGVYFLSEQTLFFFLFFFKFHKPFLTTFFTDHIISWDTMAHCLALKLNCL